MTDINDFGDPIGYDDPEPCDWYDAPIPVDLDEIDEACCTVANSDDEQAKTKAVAYVMSVAQALVAECRAQRQQLAEWQALPVREEWAVTPSRQQVPQEFDFRFPDWLTAEEAAKRQDRQLWRRRSSVRPSEPIELDSPF